MNDFKDGARTLTTDPSISRLQDQIISAIREHDCFVNDRGDVVGCICGQTFGKDFSTTELLWDQHVADEVIAALPECAPSSVS